VPIAMALRPTADTNMPGRDGPVSASGESPSGKNGIVVAPLSNTGLATATGAPGARGGGSCARKEPAMAVVTTRAANTRFKGFLLPEKAGRD
jgi:hypothetical protein